MKFSRLVFLSLFAAVCTGTATAQSNSITEWSYGKCNSDPFNDKGIIECFIFVAEQGEEPKSIETTALSSARLIRLPNSRVLMMLQFASQKHPPLIKDTKTAKNFLLRIDQGTVHTATPDDIYMDRKSDGLIFQNYPINGALLRELINGKMMYVRYTEKSGEQITQTYSLKNFTEAFAKMSSEFNELSSKGSSASNQ